MRMNLKQVPPIPYFFYTLGVILLVVGLGVWWYQNRALVTLNDPTGRVGLAVIATQAPATPTSTAVATNTPTRTPTPALTDSAVAQTPALTVTPTETPSPTPTPDPFPPSTSAPSRLVIPKIGVETPVVTMVWEYV